MIRGISPFTALTTPDTSRVENDGIAELAQRSFRLTLLAALRRAPQPTTTAAANAGDGTAAPDASQAPAPLPPIADDFAPRRPARSGGPAADRPIDDERVQIRSAAARAAVDPRFLEALRRAENGGPGREFGVLSVPAPTYEDQARVAAETIRKNAERFERAGGTAIDAAGRYTEEFIRFFSSRYAPIGAANDPTRLNRHHAQHLIRLYERLAPRQDS